jgi:hypothetical protein
VIPVETGLDKVRYCQFHNDKEIHCREGVIPPRKNCQRQHNRHQGCRRRANVRQETKHRSANTPERGVRNTNQVQCDAYHQAIARVHHHLQQQISVNTMGSFVQGLGHNR